MEQKIMNCPHCGKIISQPKPRHESRGKVVNCPECGSQRNCKDGLRYTQTEKIQRYLCRNCGNRFS